MLRKPYQLFDEQGRALVDKAASKMEVLSKGLLHGAAHVWIWRHHAGRIELLLQRRADNMATFAGMLDISAAGHIDYREEPLAAAVRECQEEVGLKALIEDLRFVMVHRRRLSVMNTALIENEFVWVYLLELRRDVDFELQAKEVSEVMWKPLTACKSEIYSAANDQYVPHGRPYFDMLFEGLAQALERE
ncbi:MAG TPA: NUDIX domain-containing protein [Patescibacteria group bacterium]|nr:NUDIX domain-containing protein [Patescibacteria group bacterium]